MTAQQMFLGIAVRQTDDKHVDIGFCAHDGTYSSDFAMHTLSTDGSKEDTAHAIVQYIVPTVRGYQYKRKYKFMGAGISRDAFTLAPSLPSELWKQLDVCPIVIARGLTTSTIGTLEADMEVDEIADSMARNCIK